MPQAAAVAVFKFAYTAAAAVGIKSTTAAAIAKLAVTASKVALLAGLNKVIANQNKPRQQGQLITLTVNPDEPRRLQVGKRLTAGVLIDWYVKGSKNDRLYLIVYLGEGPMGTCTRLFTGGRAIHGTPLTHGTRTVIPGWRSTESGTRGDRLWVTYYDGRPGQTADSYLVSQSVGWSSNHVGTGCAYAIVEAQWDSDNMRSPPVLQFELEGAKLYDRRKDTTAGGSGSHRHDDPATWEVSDNPAVALDHYLLGRYTGAVKTFGIGLDAADVPYDRFAALANLCDEDVDRKVSGTLKRYRSNGFLFSDRSYGDTIRDLCRAMNARPADFGGRIGVIDSEERTPVMTISDADVIESVPEQYSPKRSWGEMVSEVRGTYQDPAQLYQAVEYPRVSDAGWIAEDGGSPKEATLDLEMETDVERAQRLAYLYAVRERRQAQLTGTYSLRTIELEQGDWFVRAGGIFGTSPGKVFEVIDRSLDAASMTVTISAFEVDPADSAWDESAAADPPPAAIGNEDTLLDMAVPSLTVTGITLEGAAARLPAIKVEWTAPDDPRVRQIIVEAVPQAGGVPTSAVMDVETGEVTFTNGITDDTDYHVRARYVGTFYPSEWTATFEVTTTGDYSVGAATSVPWSGVTGTGKPADNADVTAANTAAGIAGQGALATKNAVDLATGEVTNKSLANVDSSANTKLGGIAAGATVGARAGTNLYRTDGSTVMTQAEVRTPEGTAAAIAGQGWGATASESAASNAQSGVGGNSIIDTGFRKGTAHWNVAATAGSAALSADTRSGGLRVGIATGTGVTVGQSVLLRNQAGTVYGIPCKPGDRIGVRALVGASNCSALNLYIRFRNAAGTSVGSISGPVSSFGVGDGDASTFTEAVNVATAPTGAVGAVVELWGTASTTAPVVRMALPTMSILPAGYDIAPPLSLGFDGSPGADPTLTNTAAAITGQGVWATGNYYEQSGDPGSVPNGSFWFKTDTNEFYVRRSGAWGKVADIAPPPSTEVQAAAKTGSGANITTSGTTWVVAVTIDMTVAAGGLLEIPFILAIADAAISLSSGSSFAGNWRIMEATQAAPSTKTQLFSGTFTVTDTGGGFFSITGFTAPSGLVANTYSGACRYTLEIQRASGSNNVTGGGIDFDMGVRFTAGG